ncbi:ABC transporter permease [Donghicola sp.]|uniref:ABC transporter permease n=1 Tax=Donghicola sp. TaxID=1929294 RepID=UPI0025F4B7B8|nr:ABC transporter permease [Donghicola sp.]MCT4578074.1 ABC transporter permease [Donghicola sp.]
MVDQNAAGLVAKRRAQSTKRSFASMRTISALVLREMSTRYGRTPGGYIWSLLEPIAAILFLSLGFSLIIRTPPLGTSFLLFYTTGFLPFNMYNNISNTTARAINYSKSLLKFPAVTWLDAIFARLLLNSLTNVLIIVLLIGSVYFIVDARSTVDLPLAVMAVALSVFFGFAVGTVNCVLLGLFPLWELAWSIITRPLFIASGVLFLYRDLPEGAQQFLWFNPLMQIVGMMRAAFYSTYDASYASVSYILGVSLALLTLGLILMGRYHQDILNR